MKEKNTEKLEIPVDIHIPSNAKDTTPERQPSKAKDTTPVSIQEDIKLDQTQKTNVVETEAPAIKKEPL